MTVQGLYAFRFQGRYYVFHNRHNSHPEGLGKGLIDKIPRESGSYQTWLTSMRAEYAEQAQNLEKTRLPISYDVLRKTQISNNPGVPALRNAVNERIDHSPSFFVPTSESGDVQWIYVVDLDREIFTINGTALFKLSKIPGNWMEALGGTQEEEIDIKTMDSGIIASLMIASPPPDQQLLREYQALSISIVKPRGRVEFENARIFAPLLGKHMFDKFVRHFKSTLDYCLPGWTTSDLPFREFSYAVLCLASQSPRRIRFENMACFKGAWKDEFLGFVRSDGQTPKAEFVSNFASGCHLAGEAKGSAPPTDCYWFEGVLVCLAVQLHQSDNYEQAIARVARQRKLQWLSSFHAVIISLEHLVLVRVFSSGHIEHTKALRLIEVIPPITGTDLARNYVDNNKNPEESFPLRPGLFHEDDIDAEKSDVNADKSDVDAHNGVADAYKGDADTDKNDIDADKTDMNPGKGDIDADGDDVDADEENIDAFLALAHVLEAANNDRLKPTRSPVQGRLPAEMYKQVIDSTDFDTWKAYPEVSRNFRSYCQERWKLNNDLTLVGCSPSGYTIENCHGQILEMDHLNLEGEHPWEDDEFKISRPGSTTEAADTQYLGLIGLDDGRSSFTEALQLTVPSSFVSDCTETDADRLVNEDAENLVEMDADTFVEMDPGRNLRRSIANEVANVPLYELFKRYIPSPNTPATTRTLSKLFDFAVFRPYHILGHLAIDEFPSNGEMGNYAYGDAWDQPTNTSIRLHTRYDGTGDHPRRKYFYTHYAVVCIKQCSQDTPTGWTRAIEQATSLAKSFVGQTCSPRDKSTRRGDAVPPEGTPFFVALVIISTKMMLFQLDGSVLRLPPRPATILTEDDEFNDRDEPEERWNRLKMELDSEERERRGEERQKRQGRKEEQMALEKSWWDTVREQVTWKQEPKGVFDVTKQEDRAGVAEVMESIQAVGKKIGGYECQG